eukprot:12881512-Prorocentrum_lima.AAC.1
MPEGHQAVALRMSVLTFSFMRLMVSSSSIPPQPTCRCRFIVVAFFTKRHAQEKPIFSTTRTYHIPETTILVTHQVHRQAQLSVVLHVCKCCPCQ